MQFSNVTDFLAQPFNAQGSALQWFLFIGLILAMLWGWHLILRDVSKVYGEIS